jgi:hypothetical protein
MKSLADRIRCGSITRMRTTLDIDDDVLFAAKELAAKERKTAGKILSEFFRRALQSGRPGSARAKRGQRYATRNGVPLVPSRGEVVTTEHIQRLMEEEGV